MACLAVGKKKVDSYPEVEDMKRLKRSLKSYYLRLLFKQLDRDGKLNSHIYAIKITLCSADKNVLGSTSVGSDLNSHRKEMKKKLSAVLCTHIIIFGKTYYRIYGAHVEIFAIAAGICYCK